MDIEGLFNDLQVMQASIEAMVKSGEIHKAASISMILHILQLGQGIKQLEGLRSQNEIMQKHNALLEKQVEHQKDIAESLRLIRHSLANKF